MHRFFIIAVIVGTHVMAQYHDITDVPGVKVGHQSTAENIRGCTVLLFEEGAVASCEVRGSAPGTRETDLLKPMRLVQKIHAIVLSGGSAFGLDAASGVMAYLEEQKIGYPIGDVIVPIVPAAVIFDLQWGKPHLRPTKETGYLACEAASDGPVERGNIGVGLGATVGKIWGQKYSMKAGVGSSCLQLANGIVIGALVVVNAVGAVYDDNGKILAGPYDRDKKTFIDNHQAMLAGTAPFTSPGNTTIAVIATNARLTKEQARKVAELAHNGLARCIYPVHTMYDGDTVFVASTGDKKEMDTSFLGTLAADVLIEAVHDGVHSAKPALGLPAAIQIHKRR